MSGSAAQDPRGESALEEEARQAAAERAGERATARDQDEKEIEAAMEAAVLRRKALDRLVAQGHLSPQRRDAIDAADTDAEDKTLAGYAAAGITPLSIGNGQTTWHGLNDRDLAKRMKAERWYDIYYGPLSDMGAHANIGGARLPLPQPSGRGELAGHRCERHHHLITVRTRSSAHRAIPHWAEPVQLVDASYAGIWELPVVGEVTAPSAVLVRPDGHVAWVAMGPQRCAQGGRADPAPRWCGSADLWSPGANELIPAAQFDEELRRGTRVA